MEKYGSLKVRIPDLEQAIFKAASSLDWGEYFHLTVEQ